MDYRTTMQPLPPPSASVPASARVSKAPVIGPQLYDALTTNPDDRTVVRFSQSGEILAATPSRLIAHITSPSFLDYELLSDFFLTFRSFLSSRDLAAYLISRLQWAVNRQDDFGRIVRVRTFVALRHWILNYFIDDFVPLYRLRTYFCDLVNKLYDDLRARNDGGGGDLKIVGELKKCWRRTCALYWETEDSIRNDSPDAPLLPGGQAGSTVSYDERASLPLVPSTPPQQTDRIANPDTVGSKPSEQYTSQHLEWARRARHTPQNSLSSPYIPSQEYETVALSPASEHSIQVLSCSIPVRGLGKPEPAYDMPLYPHPVPHVAQARGATSPHSSSKSNKRRPTHGHKRSGSFSDALRDHRGPLPVPKITSSDDALSDLSRVPGSLIRGVIFQPGSPYIDVKNGGIRQTKSQLQLELLDPGDDDARMRQSQSNPGVKKMLSTVRRALSSKQPSGASPRHHGSSHHHNVSLGRTSNPGSPSTVSGGIQKRRYGRNRPQQRIDLLAARVAERFEEAVKQEKESQATPSGQTPRPDLGGFQFNFEKQAAGNAEEKRDSILQRPPRLLSEITTGDRSIIIMDDTGIPEIPMMTGALPSPPTTENILAATTMPPYHHKREISIDGRISQDPIRVPPPSMLFKNSDGDIASELHRPSIRSSHRSIADRPHRRSFSAGQERLHSFQRRGSRKLSLARTASLRRATSFNSGLTRENTAASVATFLTMSSDNDPFFLDHHPPPAAGPTRQLRRRPGGDLRAVDNVHEMSAMERPDSTDTVSNRTHSISNSVVLRVDRYVESASPAMASTDEEDIVPKQHKSISLVATHSSQPNLRPSFEAEVAKLAALPDDTDDDGGIESALMKLEGRYEKRTPDPSPRNTAITEQVPIQLDTPVLPSAEDFEQDSAHLDQVRTNETIHQSGTTPSELRDASVDIYGNDPNNQRPAGSYLASSEESFSSIPLLDRGLSQYGNASRTERFESMTSSAKPSPLKTGCPPSWFGQPPGTDVASANSSMEHVVETESMKRIPKNGTVPEPFSAPRESFLLDDDEDLTDDDDSAVVARSNNTSHGVRSFFDDEPAIVTSDKEALPVHPLRHPPTPPLSANQRPGQAPLNTTLFERGLPTPGLTPTSRFNNQTFPDATQPVPRLMDPPVELQKLQTVETTPPTPAHLPFVLAYDAETLAQHFTIIEKDALDEIDWKELIELRWKQSSPKIRDWVEYLQTQEARGVDVVIARFNLVVKWVVSECLLTEAIEERARCIVKYIHIASHARRLRNYATMYQITIALLSTDVSRLRQTWALIPPGEMATMRKLEALVQPLRNFHNLRVEMETASAEEGCIPFIGMYLIHPLVPITF